MIELDIKREARCVLHLYIEDQNNTSYTVIIHSLIFDNKFIFHTMESARFFNTDYFNSILGNLSEEKNVLLLFFFLFRL